MVQDAVREVLEAIYEQDFLPCSHGFRRGRSAHDAVRALSPGAIDFGGSLPSPGGALLQHRVNG